jgi:crotonobetaine/carnitine-CoA ligase
MFLTVPEAVEQAGERFGERLAVAEKARSLSFSALSDAVARAAGGLEASPGDRVLIVSANSVEMVLAWLGVIHAGAIPAAVNPELVPAELEYLAKDLEASTVLVDADRRDAGRKVARVVSARFGIIGELQGDAVEAQGADPMATAAIVYTSGTTSRPKGVQVRHAAYTETGLSFPGWIGLGERERLWACLPFFHINAQAYSLMSALMCGHSLAVSDRFHATTFWQDARELEVTEVNLIGAMLTFVERQPQERFVESGLRTVYAAPAPEPDRRRELEARFKVRVTSGYGMSENTFGCAESRTSRDKPGSIGRPRQPASGAFVNRLLIVDGELCFQNPVLTPGYWNAPEQTAQALVDGWLHTGDGGRVDEDGDVFLTTRLKDMIRRRGENISPGEVEEALRAHPAVAEAAVFGVPAEVGEEEVVAAVVLAEGAAAGEDELKEFAGRSLARFKVPSAIVFRERLPLTATMRVAKDVLRQEYAPSRP